MKNGKRLKYYITGTMTRISPAFCSRVMYFCLRKKPLRLKPPVNLNEKFMWLKLNIYNRHPLVRLCADKYGMRKYAEEKGCGKLLNTLYGVWNRAEEIDFDALPDAFVLKCNHGSGYNIICRDKAMLDIDKTRKQLDLWLREDYWKYSAELNYRGIEKKIICEKLLTSPDGGLPGDCKIMCLNGKPAFILYCTGRGGKVKKTLFDTDWNYLPESLSPMPEDVQRPKTLAKMLEYSRLLSADFPAVRVDFFDGESEPVLGELTFTPAGCVSISLSEEGLIKYGDMLDLGCDKVKTMLKETLIKSPKRFYNG